MPSLPPRHSRPKTTQHKRPERNRQQGRALHTGSKRWRTLRALVLQQEPLCRECAKDDILRAATQVDHVDGDDSNNDLSNLQPLCHRCHSKKTAREDGGFGNGEGGSKVKR